MKKYFLVLFLLIIAKSNAQTIDNLTCEQMVNPMGITNKIPSLSWKIKSLVRGTKQTAYQILVADSENNLKKDIGNLWNSGIIKSNQSYMIKYSGKSIEPNKRYFWKVKIWNEKNKPSPFSESAWFETAMFEKSDWIAHWIGLENKPENYNKSIEIQKEFNLNKRAVRARVYVTALGAYHLIINGKKIGNRYLTPDFTDFSKQLNYQIYELSNEDLSIGINFITTTLGNSWWSPEMPWSRGKDFKEPCRLLFQMELDFYDGSKQIISSDNSWKVRNSPILSNSLMNGESYDARLEYGKDWINASILDEISSNIGLFPKIDAGLEIGNEIKAISINESKKGKYIYDFGEILNGFVHLQVEGKVGKEIEIRYAETLNEKGLIDSPKNKNDIVRDSYILKGYGIEQWEPKFSFKKFRYIELEGFPKKPDENTLKVKVIAGLKDISIGKLTENQLTDLFASHSKENSPYKNDKISITELKPMEQGNNSYVHNGELIESEWQKINNKRHYYINIPANEEVILTLPLEDGTKVFRNILESGKPLVQKNKPMKIDGIKSIKMDKKTLQVELGSGKYDFQMD